jgi:hypothetical protein
MIGENVAEGAVTDQQRPRKGPSEIENRIFDLLKSLPDLKPNISAEYCRDYASSLNGAILMAQMNYQRAPAQQCVGAKRTQAELLKLSDLAGKLARAMSHAHLETNNLIGAALPKGATLSQYKRVVSEIVEVVYRAADDAGALTGRGKKPSDQYAAKVAQAAAQAFTKVTGRKAALIVKPVPAGFSGNTAKSGGPFLDFLINLFAILGIDASAEYHARQLRRNRT